jgi:hypothetical protein
MSVMEALQQLTQVLRRRSRRRHDAEDAAASQDPYRTAALPVEESHQTTSCMLPAPGGGVRWAQLPLPDVEYNEEYDDWCDDEDCAIPFMHKHAK